ncbi:MAG: hypothetical protein KBE91_10495 [Bacteroidia bacterium]|nr:hypothetical protein [Bacteroidia bacterium]MBP9690030.1 hypothetical protein [Bacteroidia bacterium]
MKSIKHFTYLMILITALSSCNRLYWQRNKVRAAKRKQHQTMQLYINNKVPYIFNDDFNELVEKNCKKEFEKLGYSFNYKDTPDFVTVIKINMDSFTTSGVYTFNTGGTSSFWRTYKRNSVRAILFDYTITNTKFKTIKWSNQNDIYYFNDANTNSKRSNNMVKYTIRYGK